MLSFLLGSLLPSAAESLQAATGARQFGGEGAVLPLVDP